MPEQKELTFGCTISCNYEIPYTPYFYDEDDPPDEETLECHILDLIDSGAIDVGDMIQVNITRIDDE